MGSDLVVREAGEGARRISDGAGRRGGVDTSVRFSLSPTDEERTIVDLRFSEEEQAFADEARTWLAEHLELPPAFASMDDEVAWGREWQAELAAGRWVGIHWPHEFGGRGAPPVHVAIFNSEYTRARAPQPVNRVGINLAGPTLLAHGSDDQKQRWIGPILTAEEIWCQLFSEPDAGSDLAGLRTTATPVDGGWVLNGQKVWTSYAQYARWGICLARTDKEAPKHRGISYLVVDMTEPGIEIRPLVQVTGEAEFNEVFLTDVFVPDDDVVGAAGDGWRIARATLGNERVSIGGGGVSASRGAVAAIAEATQRYGERVAGSVERAGRFLADEHALRLLNLRRVARSVAGAEPGPEGNVTKLLIAEHVVDRAGLTAELFGADVALLTAPAKVSGLLVLGARGMTIAGGTSEVTRNQIAERILGLPRDPLLK
jgi:alkylation response protein AidB-like acyl-CoA dehydrogenase